MHSAGRRMAVLLGAVALAVVADLVFADDREIYLGTAGQKQTSAANVLFIVDTSATMTAKDGGQHSRLVRVQTALQTVLATATNINIGLMRFSDVGGPVLYPVTAIDQQVAPPFAPPFAINVAHSADDATEVDGVVTLAASTLALSVGSNEVISGLRFQNLPVPQGAIITSARLRLVAANTNVAATAIEIRGELTANSQAFNANNHNLSSRQLTASGVTWAAQNEFTAPGEHIIAPPVTSILQEIVAQADWCGGNAASFLLTGTSADPASHRLAQAVDGGGGMSVQLLISYHASKASGCVARDLTYQVASRHNNAEESAEGFPVTGKELTFEAAYNNHIGLHFDHLAIPKNALITEAYLEFTASQTSVHQGASLAISAADETTPENFSNHPRYLLRDKPKTAAVAWRDIQPWYKNSRYQSPAITSVVQHMVNRGDWFEGNSMLLILSSMAGTRKAYAFDGKPSSAPRLMIKFVGNASPTSAATARSDVVNHVNQLGVGGHTPIVDTVLEASRYYAGWPVYYGLTRGTSAVSEAVRRNTRVSHRNSYLGFDAVLPQGCTPANLNAPQCITAYIPNGASYISPIHTKPCQTNNHIVLLAGGQADLNHSVAAIEAVLGQPCTGSGGEKCGLDLVAELAKPASSVFDFKVTTHAISVATDPPANTFLQQLARHGGGGFYSAANSADLVTALRRVLRRVKDINATFVAPVAPAAAVAQSNRVTLNHALYFALFQPTTAAVWPGNLKKYRLDGADIRDKNGVLAVAEHSGSFTAQAHSYWSIAADGNDVGKGGAASNMQPDRVAYVVDDPGVIVTSSKLLAETNDSITTHDLAIAHQSDPQALRTAILQWARGVDVLDIDADGSTTDVRLQMGDPMHSQPVIVNYSDTDSAVLVGTNHGFLHSIDTHTGAENFAIIPKPLLVNLRDLYLNSASYAHIYGLDGDLLVRETATKKLLYVGMRRGGNNYYAFDISSKTAPSLVFAITGGSVGFEKLGQTWSKPTISKITTAEGVRHVLIFGGGYDDTQDSKHLRLPDVVGNAVFMVDADTGQLLWQASNANADLLLPAMRYSIPAAISAVDRDRDGFADHLYVADTGGQVFRLDIHHGKSVDELVSGGLLASFGSDDSSAMARRFYYPPDVAEIRRSDQQYYAVAVASGYRAHPLNTAIQDGVFVIKDSGVFELDANGDYSLPTPPIQPDHLYDATQHLLTAADASVQQAELKKFNTKQGWFLKLDASGEKAMASPLILNHKVIFTSYTPAMSDDSGCGQPMGSNRVYLVNLLNGNAVTDLNGNKVVEQQDRFAELRQPGIAPQPQILLPDRLQPVVCFGAECAAIVSGEDPCDSAVACLLENVYQRQPSVRRYSWRTESERQ